MMNAIRSVHITKKAKAVDITHLGEHSVDTNTEFLSPHLNATFPILRKEITFYTQSIFNPILKFLKLVFVCGRSVFGDVKGFPESRRKSGDSS